MGSIIDSVVDFFEDAVDALVNIVSEVWNEIVAPLAEAFFAVLGFEDETIVNTYVVASSLYGDQSYVNPFKKIPLNKVIYKTETYDEIMNIFIAGEHVRIRYMLRKTESYGNTPVTTLDISTIPLGELDTIITAEEGEPITIVNARVIMPNVYQYIKAWLEENPDISGLIFDSSNFMLRDLPTVYAIDRDNPFVYDAGNDVYDINVLSNINYDFEMANAVNILAAPPDTYGLGNLVETAPNVLAAPAGTYNVDAGPPIILIMDTAVDDHVPTDLGFVSATIVMDTAIDDHSPIPTIEELELDTTELILEDLVPPQLTPMKRFEVMYTLDSDVGVPQEKKWWFYNLEDPPQTYPQLYPTAPTFPGDDKTLVLPITPIKEDGIWLLDTPDTQEAEEAKRTLKRYGLSLRELTQGYRNDDAGNAEDIVELFFLFGINLATAGSQAEFNYLFEMLSDFATNSPDLASNDYITLRDNQTLVKSYLDGAVYTPVVDGGNQIFWNLTVNTDPDTILDLMSDYLDPEYADYKVAYNSDPTTNFGSIFGFQSIPTRDEVIGDRLQELFEAVGASTDNNQTSYSITSGNYNFIISYGAVTISQGAGMIGDGTVGNLDKQIIADKYQLIIRKQTDINVIDTVHVVDLTGFSYIRQNASNVYLTATDFVGDTVGDVNIANNFILPITYGYLLELGIVERKEVLYRAGSIVQFAINVVELAYYETAAFAKFFGLVLKIVAIVILVVSYGSSTGVSNVLWTAAKLYGTKIIAEYAIQQMLLANPDSKLAFAFAVGIAIVAGSIGGDTSLFEVTIANALKAISAVEQVTTQYTAIQSGILIEEQQDFLETAMEKDERLKQAIANTDFSNDALLDYIKETITMKFADPSSFYEHRLTRNLVDQALDLDSITEVEQLLDLSNLSREIT